MYIGTKAVQLRSQFGSPGNFAGTYKSLLNTAKDKGIESKGPGPLQLRDFELYISLGRPTIDSIFISCFMQPSTWTVDGIRGSPRKSSDYFMGFRFECQRNKLGYPEGSLIPGLSFR